MKFASIFSFLCLCTALVSGAFHTSWIPRRQVGIPAFQRRLSSSSRLLPTQNQISFRLGTERYVDIISQTGIAETLLRGAFLRIASDLTGGTPLESIKCRMTVKKGSMIQACHSICTQDGILGLWSGTPSRVVEGALLGALFTLGSTLTKKQVLDMGGTSIGAALAGGLVGGVAQSIVMTPAGMIFTSLNVNRGTQGHENDTVLTVVQRILNEKGPLGFYFGVTPMILRQATNWASRSCFTELARTTLGMSQYGMLGEIGSGVIGGIASCWNTPIETIRISMQRDASLGMETQSFGGYWKEIVESVEGYPGLFRGVIPRGIQATWQTMFMVVVPNVLGI